MGPTEVNRKPEQMSQPTNQPVFHTLPPVVIALAVIIGGLEALFQIGTMGFFEGGEIWRNVALNDWAFFGQLLDHALATGQYEQNALLRMLTYPLIHVNGTHAVFAVVLLLAMGNMVGSIFRAWAVLVIFFGASITGALVYGLLLDERFPLAGAYPGVYGLIGAYTFLLWVRQVATGGSQYQAFILIGALLGFQLAFALFFGVSHDWVADVAGFAAGFGLSFLVSPGGLARFLARLRDRD